MQSLCYFSAHQRAYSPFPMPRQAAGVFIHKLEKKKKNLGHRLQKTRCKQAQFSCFSSSLHAENPDLP